MLEGGGGRCSDLKYVFEYLQLGDDINAHAENSATDDEFILIMNLL